MRPWINLSSASLFSMPLIDNTVHIFKVHNLINFHICVHLLNQHYSQDMNVSIFHKSLHVPFGNASFCPPPPSKNYPSTFLSQWIHLRFLESYINGIIEYTDHIVHDFLVWLPLLSIIILRFIFVVARIDSSFLLVAEWLYSFVWMLFKTFSKQRVSEFTGIK